MTSPKPRRTRTDAMASVVRIVQGATDQLAPPSHIPLSEDAWPYWHSIVDEMAKSDWTRHQLDFAALLARTMALLEREQRTQREEGMVIEGRGGLVRQNPRNRVVNTLANQVFAMRRSLGLTARGGYRSEDAARRRLANRQTERLLTHRDGLA